MTTYSHTLRALADPTRREILERIAEKPSSVGQLADRFPVSQPAVSQHLKVLREANLVAVTREGRTRVYHLKRDGLAALRTYLDRFWGDVLDSFSEGIT